MVLLWARDLRFRQAFTSDYCYCCYSYSYSLSYSRSYYCYYSRSYSYHYCRCLRKNTPFARAFALQRSISNCYLAPDLGFVKLLLPRICFSGGMFFPQTPVLQTTLLWARDLRIRRAFTVLRTGVLGNGGGRRKSCDDLGNDNNNNNKNNNNNNKTIIHYYDHHYIIILSSSLSLLVVVVLLLLVLSLLG